MSRASCVSKEAQDWDLFVEACEGGDIVQATCWGDSKRAIGFYALQAVCRENDVITGGAQIIVRRFGKLGAIGYVARGPLVRGSSPEEVADVLDEIERVARIEQIRHLIVQPPWGREDIEDALAARGYTVDAPFVAPSATLRIDLTSPLDSILAGMGATKRRNIRQALRRGVTVRLGAREDISAFHILHARTAKEQGFAPLSMSYLQAQWDELCPHSAIQLFIAYHDDRPLAGLWVTAFGSTVTYRLNGWNREEPQLRPTLACHWHAIQWAKQSGYRYYDLGGLGNRQNEQAIRRGDLQLPDLKEGPLAHKVGMGGQLLILPRAWQTTFNPILRPLMRLGGYLADTRVFNSTVHRLRSATGG